MNMRPSSIEEIQERVQQAKKILPVGGRTKPALSTPVDEATALDLTGINGVTAYDPSEFTFTARAGTRLTEVKKILDDHGQYLPFDPPLAQRGATLGGMAAAGLSGPGRYRYGGVRDFITGVVYVNGRGQVVHSGGKVVKNAAGFDIPKLMIGSAGRLGVLVELSFKVFPKPEMYATIQRQAPSLDEAVECLLKFSNSQADLDSLELEMTEESASTIQTAPIEQSAPTKQAVLIITRVGGLVKGLPARVERIRSALCGGEVVQGAQEEAFWNRLREMEWAPAGWMLLKVPLTPARIPAFDRELVNALAGKPVLRRYSGGGQLAWVALPEGLQAVEKALLAQGLSALVVFGPPERPWLGVRTGEAFARRVKSALDPENRFLEA